MCINLSSFRFQMVSISHPNASELFARDLGGLVKFFAMKMRYVPPPEDLCILEDIITTDNHIRIDEEVRASGFSKDDDDILMRFIHSTADVEGDDVVGDEDENNNSEEEEEEEEDGEGEEGNWKKKKNHRKSVSKVTDFLRSSSNHKDDSIMRLEKALESSSISPYRAEDDMRTVSNDENNNDSSNKVTLDSIRNNSVEEAVLTTDGQNNEIDKEIDMNRISRKENKNEWIPEAKDLEMLDAQDVFSDSEDERAGTITMLTEETLQGVKDKTRK